MNHFAATNYQREKITADVVVSEYNFLNKWNYAFRR